MMTHYRPMEIIVMPETTYILIDHIHDSHRRIFTDGRDWPKEVEPTFDGYSIGQWIDTDGDGRYDVLEVETRDFKGPRDLRHQRHAAAPDNKTVVKERIYLDKTDPNILHNEIDRHRQCVDAPLDGDRRNIAAIASDPTGLA